MDFIINNRHTFDVKDILISNYSNGLMLFLDMQDFFFGVDTCFRSKVFTIK